MAVLISPEKLAARSVLLIVGVTTFIGGSILLIVRAVRLENSTFLIRDPVSLVVGFTMLIVGLVTLAYGWKFDKLNHDNYDIFLKLKEKGILDNRKEKWLIDRLYLALLSWADKDHEKDTARRWICLINFLYGLIFLPLLAAMIMATVVLWLELRQSIGILGIFAVSVILCLIVCAWKFKKINAFLSGLSGIISATANDEKVADAEKVKITRFAFVIICVLVIISLMSVLAGMFVLETDPHNDVVNNDVILGTWKNVINTGYVSTITFNDNGTFSWNQPVVYSRTGFITGHWNNTSDGTHLTYRLTYTDTSAAIVSTLKITLTRSYYHQYGDLVTCYPYFYIDGVHDGGPFTNPDAPQISVPDVPTVIPSSSPAPGQDILVGTWKNDNNREFDWYWMFGADGTYHSSLGGNPDKTGTWTSIGTHRYRLNYADGRGIILDYKDEKIFNEYAQDVMFSRISYNDLNL